MKALVFAAKDTPEWIDVADPQIIDPTDAIIRVTTTTICGSDLHILRGHVPETEHGRVLGHEAVGIVEKIGAAVSAFAVGDRVLVSCITSCGRCEQCRAGHFGICAGGGGWLLGHTIDGVQAEYARIPFADFSMYAVPEALTDDQVVFLADILPTGYEIGVVAGRMSPGKSVAIIGAGPVGLAALVGVKLYTPGMVIVSDPVASRRAMALEMGADYVIDPMSTDAVARVMELTGGRGVDLAIEAVGSAATFEAAADMVCAGGRLANIGVHGAPVTLHMERLWIRDVTITAGLVDTWSIPMLMRLVEMGKLDTTPFGSRTFALADALEAYRQFDGAATSGVTKVLLHSGPVVQTDIDVITVAAEPSTAG